MAAGEKSFNNRSQKSSAASVDTVGLDLGKIPPQALDLEEAVLGACMIEKDAVDDVLDILHPESFYKEAHQHIFEAIIKLRERTEPVDMLTVSEELKRGKQLKTVGGRAYLAQLSMKVGSAAHIDFHAKIIAQKYLQRELIRVTSEVQRDSFDDSQDVNDVLDRAQNDILQLAEGNIKQQAETVGEISKNVLTEIEERQKSTDPLSGIPSGFTELDRITQGWQKSNLVIVAGRTSMGKTAFVLSMARNMVIEHKRPVAFFSLEMSSEELVNRLFMSESGISGDRLKGRINKEELNHLYESINNLKDAELYIDDTPGLTTLEFSSKVRRLHKQHNIQCVIIDYLQLMHAPEYKNFREQEISAISRMLKSVAKELKIPIIALSQMNRSIESRTEKNKRPQLSDLRESGAIEQDADMVVFVHRPEYYRIEELFDGSDSTGMAEIMIAKHRNGGLGDIKLRFRKELAKFENPGDEQIEQMGQIIGSKINSDDFITGGHNIIDNNPPF
ncbi:replicative DNA helicase [Bacteroidia bacterium]|nr:replicative DNA helicase [Bacteroidia bacterium]